MTDLTQFEFIIYCSSSPKYFEGCNYITDYNDHNFILKEKYTDNSGAYIKCINCNLSALIDKTSHNTFQCYVRNISDIWKTKLKCNEIIIKNIIE